MCVCVCVCVCACVYLCNRPGNSTYYSDRVMAYKAIGDCAHMWAAQSNTKPSEDGTELD